MQEPDYALIVAGPPASTLRDTLRPALRVRTCPGPARNYCPALQGDRCPLRDDAKITIVYLAGEHEFFAPGQWECVTASIAPAVIVLEGAAHASRARSRFAVVGAERGAAGVHAAIDTLVDIAPRDARDRTRG